jgi:hypothetical protein
VRVVAVRALHDQIHRARRDRVIGPACLMPVDSVRIALRLAALVVAVRAAVADHPAGCDCGLCTALLPIDHPERVAALRPTEALDLADTVLDSANRRVD